MKGAVLTLERQKYVLSYVLTLFAQVIHQTCDHVKTGKNFYAMPTLLPPALSLFTIDGYFINARGLRKTAWGLFINNELLCPAEFTFSADDSRFEFKIYLEIPVLDILPHIAELTVGHSGKESYLKLNCWFEKLCVDSSVSVTLRNYILNMSETRNAPLLKLMSVYTGKQIISTKWHTITVAFFLSLYRLLSEQTTKCWKNKKTF